MTRSCIRIAAVAAVTAFGMNADGSTGQAIVEADGHRSILPERPVKKPASPLPLAHQVGADFIPHRSSSSERSTRRRCSRRMNWNFATALPCATAFPGHWTCARPTASGWTSPAVDSGAWRSPPTAPRTSGSGSMTCAWPKAPSFVRPGRTGPGRRTVHRRRPLGRRHRLVAHAGRRHRHRRVLHPDEPLRQGRASVHDHRGDPRISSDPQGRARGRSRQLHLTPACYAAWSDIADATALVLFSGGFVCSGQLIATTAQDETPYYLTANHCISTQSAASSAEFVFRYERPTCTGSVSNGVSTSGSTLVDTWAASDNTLLRINGALPSGLFWVGWTTDSPPTGTDATCLHHPAGDYMRISFGDTRSNGVCGSSTNWVGMAGVRAPPRAVFVGHLSTATSDSSASSPAAALLEPEHLDGYGRFNRACSTASTPTSETDRPTTISRTTTPAAPPRCQRRHGLNLVVRRATRTGTASTWPTATR